MTKLSLSSCYCLGYFTDFVGDSFATGLDGNNPSLASLVQMCNPK